MDSAGVLCRYISRCRVLSKHCNWQPSQLVCRETDMNGAQSVVSDSVMWRPVSSMGFSHGASSQ